MKTIRLLLPLLALALFAGCQIKQPKTLAIQPLLDLVVPQDFVGDLDAGIEGQYLPIQIQATNLHRGADGKWTWTSLRYRQTFNIPIAPGVSYKQGAWITMGPTAK